MALSHVQAQQTLSIDQAVQQALREQPQIAQANARIEQANGEHIQAGLRPNPRMTFQSEDLRPSSQNAPFSFANSTEDYFLYGQVIESAGKRQRRLEVARLQVAETGDQLNQARRQLAAQVSIAYWTALSAHTLQQLAEQNLNTYEDDVAYIRNRVKEGVEAEADLIRIQIERDRASVKLRTAARDATQAQLDLYRIMGRADFTPVAFTASLEQTASVPSTDIAHALATRPEMEIARRILERARANTYLQRADAKPDPEAIAGYKRNVGLDTAYAALQIDLPLHNRNQGNIASAVAGEHLAEAGLREAELAVRADLQMARQNYLDDQKVVAELPESVQRANESERLSRAAYREGALDFLRLLDAERNRIEIQSEYYRALGDLQEAAVRLQWASGQTLPGEQ